MPVLTPQTNVSNGWFNTLGELPAPRCLSRVRTADWLVIGAGICGLTFARRLAELMPDEDIVVAEACRVGYGTSGRNAGFMLSHHCHGGFHDFDVARRDDVLLSAGYRALQQTVQQHQIRCDWTEWGQIYVAAGPPADAQLDEISEGFATLGVDNRYVDPDELEDLTGTRFYCRGVRVGDSALVQPAAMMRGLAATLPANVTVYENTPVEALLRDGDFRAVCARGEVQARQVVLANSFYAEQLGFRRRRVAPVSTFASLSQVLTAEQRRVTGKPDQFGLLPAHKNGCTVRRTLDGRLLMRNTTAFAREPDYSERLLQEVRANHLSSIESRWPELAGIELEATWGGVLGFTRNDGKVFGALGEGLYVLMPTDTAPMTRGTVMGTCLAEQIGGVDSEPLRILNSLPDAAWVPPDFLLRWFTERQISKFARLAPGER